MWIAVVMPAQNVKVLWLCLYVCTENITLLQSNIYEYEHEYLYKVFLVWVYLKNKDILLDSRRDL